MQLVDRWYPSSKTCSNCGYVKPELSLGERVFGCDACGLTLDRDFNASLNIRDEASRLIVGVPVGASSARKFACGVEGSGSLYGEGETFREEASTKMS